MDLKALGQYLDECVAKRMVPGVVALVGQGDKTLYFRSFGHAAWLPHMDTMYVDTLFDLASLTKVCATLPCVLHMLADGTLGLDDPIGRHMDVERKLGMRTVRMLLTHSAGLIPDHDLTAVPGTPQERLDWLCRQPPERAPGEVVYSDVGYLLLAELLRTLTGKRIDALAREWVFDPLGMAYTSFCPTIGHFAATEKVGDTVIRGIVHDENCRALQGVAGHAGLFSRAGDLALYARGYLEGKLFDTAWVKASMREQAPGRGLGWVYLAPGLCWHTGFTGTALWLDANTQTYAVLLTNRVHPSRENQATQEMRAQMRRFIFE